VNGEPFDKLRANGELAEPELAEPELIKPE